MADAKTRQEKVKIHQQAEDERVKTRNALKVSFKKIMKEPAFAQIQYMLGHLADLHKKMGTDGTGYRDIGLDIGGNMKQELVFFDKDKRISEIDKASGLEEGLAWLDSQVTDKALEPITAKKVIQQ